MAQMKVFDQNWFKEHQQKLLWFSNTKIGRWVLGITKQDFNGIIQEIAPNYISHSIKRIDDKIQITTEFKSGEPYAQHLYEAFKPFWWLLHFWDWILLDRFLPDFSFGFSTLTANPQAGGGGGNVTCDGIFLITIGEPGQTFATITTTANATNIGTTATSDVYAALQGSNTTNQYRGNYRSGFSFDTSSIGAGPTISAATFSVYGTNKGNLLGSPDFCIGAWTPANKNNIAVGDYSQVGLTSFGSISYASYSTAGYNDIAFNASGIAAILQTGVSAFSTQTSWDINRSFTGTWATGDVLSRFDGYLADNGSNEPKLVVTYSTAATANGNFLNFF